MKMKNYLDYVVSVIDKEGSEFFIEIDETYHKHIQPFKQLEQQNEKFKIKDFLSYKGTDNVTGYEIASYLGGKGYIIFFHTDVSNLKIKKKNASIIIPKEMTDIQKEKLLELIQILDSEKFSYYLNIVSFKKKKSYKIVHNHISLALLKKQVYNYNSERGNGKCKNMKVLSN